MGANEKFLSTFGFRDESAIVRKTDVEMGWYVDGDPFADEETAILEKGKVITNRLGRCIIKGVVRTILVCKEPLYEDGEIAGILGSFVLADEMAEAGTLPPGLPTRDDVTKLMSAAALTDAIAQYIEGWRVRHENFAVIRITLSEYYRTVQSYGEKTARESLRQAGQMIAELLGNRGVCSRLFSGNFAVLMKCTDKKDVEDLAERIAGRIEDIHFIDDYPVTFLPKVETCIADEMKDLHAIVGLASASFLHKTSNWETS